MNAKQLQYAIELAKIKNFSKVSEKLNIAQPSLSKQIISLEKELGVKIFDRNYIPLRLTPAGEHFVKEAEELLFKEDCLKKTMELYKSGENGRLSIGISPFRSLCLLPKIAKNIRKRFPGVELHIHDTNSDSIRKELAEGKLDFAIINLPIDESIFEYTKIEPDILVLAVPSEMTEIKPKEDEEFDFSNFADLPFIVVDPSKEMRQLFIHLTAKEQINPNIVMEVVGLTSAWAMVQAGIGATLLPLQFVREQTFDREKILLFKIKSDAYRRQPVIATRRGQHLSEYVHYAIELLTEKNSE